MINDKNSKNITVGYADKESDSILARLKRILSGKEAIYRAHVGNRLYRLSDISCDMEFDCASGLLGYPKLIDAFEVYLKNKTPLIENAIKIEKSWNSIDDYIRMHSKLTPAFLNNGIKEIYEVYDEIDNMNTTEKLKLGNGEFDIKLENNDPQFKRIRDYAKKNRAAWLKLNAAVNKDKIKALSSAEKNEYSYVNQTCYNSKALYIFGACLYIIVKGRLYLTDDDDRTGVRTVDMMKL